MGIVLFKKIIAAAVSISIVLPSATFAEMMGPSVATSAGDIAADGSTQTGVDRAQNGVPLVNIAPPSGAGVSHNRYQDFNVGSEGAIMNNSSRMENSLLGGAVYANPNLRPGEEGARVILNEVTSTRASRLLGATEIHGRSAEYILANPNGITCNGCEFINTPKVLLGTGRPEMRNGDFMGLHMDPIGQVIVEGAGLNAGNVDYFGIVTRAAKINGEIHANDLSIKTGNQHYDAKMGEIESGKSVEPQALAVSVDSMLLGGISAGRITLESTELGVGVNLGGSLASRQDLQVTADGKIVYAGVASETGSVAVQSKHSGIEQTGYAAAKNDVRLEAEGDIQLNDGVVSAGADARISAGGDISNQADIQALGNAGIHAGENVSNQADIQAMGKADIHAGNSLMNLGNVFSNKDAAISAGGDADLAGGQITALGNVNVTAQGGIANKSVVQAGEKVTITADKSFQNEGIIASVTDTEMSAGENLDLAGGKITAGSDLNVSAKGAVTNSSELEAGQKIAVKSDQSITNQDGKIHANGALSIAAGEDVEFKNGTMISNGDLIVHAQGSFLNNAELIAGGNAVITAGKGAGFRGGQVMAGGNTDISVGGNINLEGGKVLANQDLIVNAQGSLLNGAELIAGRNAILSAGKEANYGSGKVLANEDLSVKARKSLSNNSQMLAGRNADIASDKDVNFSAGEMAAGGDLHVKSGGSVTNKIVIHSGGHAAFAAGGDFNNESTGKLYSNGNTDISAGEDVDIEGEAVARENLNVTAKGDMDIKGEIQAERQINLTAENALLNQGIVLAGTKENDGNPEVKLQIQAGSLTNIEDGQILSYGNTDILVNGNADIESGHVIARGDLNMGAKGKISNKAEIQAGGNAVLSADSLVTSGRLLAHGNLSAAIDKDVELTGGEAAADGDIHIAAKGNLTNQIDVQTGRNLTLAAEKDMTNRGTLLAGNDLELVANDGIFNGADLHADGKLTLATQKTFTNHKTLSAGTAARAGDASTGIRLTADSIDNSSTGNLLSYGNLDMSVNRDINLGGRLFSYGDMNISGNGAITNSADIQAERKVALTAVGDIRNNGAITGGKDRNSATGIALNSNALQNNGKLLSFGNTQVAVRQDLDMTGEIMTYGDLAIHGDKNIINKIDLVTGGRTDISAGLDFSNGYLSGEKSVLRQIQSDGDTAISARNITNYGSIETGGNLFLTAQNSFLNDRRVSDQGLVGGNALLLSRGNTVIYADRITNSAGEILSMAGITLQKDAQGNRSSSVDNISNLIGSNYTSAVIEGEHDVNIRSNALNNMGEDYGDSWVERVRVGNPGNERLELVYEDQVRSVLKTQPSYITAGRDVMIDGGMILNHGSAISAGRNLTLTGGPVNNELTRIGYGGLERIYQNIHRWNDCNYFGGDCNSNEIIYEAREIYGADAVSSFGPVLYAGQNLTINSEKPVVNGTLSARHQKSYNNAELNAVRQTGVIPTLGVEIPRAKITETILSDPGQAITVQAADFSGTSAKVIAFDPKAVQSAYAPPKSPISLTDNSLFNLSALFGLSKNPESRYVIESRSQYARIDGLKGSQYFLDRIGYNPHTDTKLLGDEHFQAKLIERSIREATGRIYLEQGVGSALDQLETLYNNAFEEFKDHNLSVGIALSAEQIANLKSDIVWLVETVIEVNGKPQKVLVPQVYLARATREGLENPTATIEGKIVSIQAKDDIVNTGKMASQGDMALFSGQDILNQAGKISSGKDLLLSAEGSITSSNINERAGVTDNWKDKIVAYGSIEAGQNAVLVTGKDINIVGTGLKAVNDLGLSAGEDVNIVADRLDSHFHAQNAGGDSFDEYTEDSTRHLMANVESGGNMRISSGKDIGIIASNVSAAGNGSMISGGHLNILSATDSDYRYAYRKETAGMDPAAMALGAATGLITGGYVGAAAGLMAGANAQRGEAREDESYHTRETASHLNFGGNLTLVSAGDTSIISSKLKADGKTRMLAGMSLNQDGSLEKVNDEGGIYVGAKEEIHRERHVSDEFKPDYLGVVAGAAVSGRVAGLAEGYVAGVTGAAGASVQFSAAAGEAAGTWAGKFMANSSKNIINKREAGTSNARQSKLASSEVSSGQDMGLSAEKEIVVSASKLRSAGDIALESRGDVTVASGKENFNQMETRSKTSFDNLSVDFNRSSVDLNWTQEGKENEKETGRVTQKQSELAAGGNISIRSGNDTNLVSSNLLAGRGVKIDAGRDVNMLTAKETEKVAERESSFKNTFTQSIGNSWLESGYAAYDAANQLKDAAGGDNGTTEGKANTAIASAKAAITAYQLAKTAQAVANDATTAATLGFHTNLSMTQELETKSFSSEKARDLGTGIASQDIEVAAGRNIGARGVNLAAEGGALHLKAGNEVKIESSENSAGTSFSTDKMSLKTILGSTGGDFIPTLSMSRSGGGSAQVTQNNSQISANGGTVTIESGGNTDILGVNVKGKNVDMTGVGGNLTLASKQDRSESNSECYSLTLGMQNVGFSVGRSESKENWTNSQSSIIGAEGVAIQAKEVNMVGSVIANQKEDGADGGNLSVKADKLNYQDLKDTSESSSFSFGIGVSKGSSEKREKSWGAGSASISVATGGHKKEGLTRATLGEGNIEVGSPSDIAGINRDLSQSQVTTKDDKTGGLNVDVSVSNKYLADIAKDGIADTTEERAKDAYKAIKELPKNAPKAIENVGIAGRARLKVLEAYVAPGQVAKALSEKLFNKNDLEKKDIEIIRDLKDTAISNGYDLEKMTVGQKINILENYSKNKFLTDEEKKVRDAAWLSLENADSPGWIEMRNKQRDGIVDNASKDADFWITEKAWVKMDDSQREKFLQNFSNSNNAIIGNTKSIPVNLVEIEEVRIYGKYNPNYDFIDINKKGREYNNFYPIVNTISHEGAGHGYQDYVIENSQNFIKENPAMGNQVKMLELSYDAVASPGTKKYSDNVNDYIYRYGDPAERDAWKMGDGVAESLVEVKR